MKAHLNFSSLPVKVVLLILALTGLVAWHVNPTAGHRYCTPEADTTRSNTEPIGLIPWATSLLETKSVAQTLAGWQHQLVTPHCSPDELITNLADDQQIRSDTIGSKQVDGTR